MGSPYSPISPAGIPQYLPVLATAGFLLLARYKREMRKTMPWGDGRLVGIRLWSRTKERGLLGTVTPRSGKDCQ